MRKARIDRKMVNAMVRTKEYITPLPPISELGDIHSVGEQSRVELEQPIIVLACYRV